MTCIVCGKHMSQDVFCLFCLRDVEDEIERKRNQVVNDAMEQIDREADEVYANDPTKGRGRGPKWV